jgi:hypothetical protein
LVAVGAVEPRGAVVVLLRLPIDMAQVEQHLQ